MQASTPRQHPTEEIFLDGTSSSISALNSWFDDLAGRWNLPGRLAHDMKLCMSEAVTNVILHGLSGDELECVHVTVFLLPDMTRVVVRDEGRAFNPLVLPEFVPATSIASAEVGGLGIKLMIETAEQLNYRRDGSANELTFTFPPASGAPR